MSSLTERIAEHTRTEPERATAYPGRPPVTPSKFVPPWLKRARKQKYGLARPLEPA